MIFESLLIHFSDFSRFSGSPSANFRKNREIGRIQTPLRILGEHPWNRRVECESGRFTDFWGFSQAPHQQISGKIFVFVLLQKMQEKRRKNPGLLNGDT